jgi:hypothetical protein
MAGVIARLEPFSSGRIIKLTGTFPFTIASYALNYLTTKCTLCFTNLNASKVAYKWAGKEAKNIFVLAQATGECSCAILLVTMHDTIRLSCIADKSMISNP